MANQLATNPWLIDTPSASALYTHLLHNCQFEYIGYSSASSFVEVQDQNEHVIARLKGAADLQTVRSGKVGWVEGMLVPITASDGASNMVDGKLIAYFE